FLGVLILLAGAVPAMAQSASDQLTVNAVNQGIFQFDIAATTIDLGTVNANGDLLGGNPGTLTGVRNGTDDGATYTLDDATTWTCSSAPRRNVDIAENGSSVSGVLPLDALAVRSQTPSNGGTSGGWIDLGSGGTLVSGMTNVGNGANSATGDLDLQLTVMDTDPVGSTTWTVVLTASSV
ncbi:MAG: hypothetical protein LJE95_05075, partial [Acidobacteria bacterium]|nr:hypothetical protein [Acidobacteriota bacterium]